MTLAGEQVASEQVNVLVIGGNQQLTRELGKGFAGVSCRVLSVRSAKEAVVALSRIKISLLVIDLVLLDGSIRSLLKNIRNHKVLSLVPCLGVIQATNAHACKEWEREGIRDFLFAPLEIERIKKKAEYWLNNLDEPLKPQVSANEPPDSEVAISEMADSEITEGQVKQKSKKVSLLQSLQHKIIKGEINLPPQPKLLHKLISMMQSGSASLGSIGEVVEKEPSLTARILRTSNSVQFASNAPARNVKEGLMRIGLERALRYVMVLNTDQNLRVKTQEFAGAYDRIWRHSVTTAVVSKLLGETLGYSKPDNLFSYALLHDVGKLSLLRALEEMHKNSNEGVSEQSMMQLLDKLHVKLGTVLMQKWMFPTEYIETVLYHHEKPVSGRFGKHLTIVAFANLVAHELEEEFTEQRVMSLLKTPHAHLLKLRYHQVFALEEHVNAELEAMESLFQA